MSRGAFLSTLTVMAGLLACSPAWSAEPPRDGAQEAAVSAQNLQAQGRSAEAIQVLDGQRGQCAEGPEGQTCRQILDYSKGYVLQQESADSEYPAEALREAAAAYERVLADSPTHGPTLDNMVTVYRHLGEPEGAIPYFERALESGNATPRTVVQLGDLLLQEDKAEEARSLYRKALETNPGDEAASQRLVLSYELSPDASGVAELLRLGELWEETIPTAARDAYEAVMRIAHAVDPDQADLALVRWADLLGRSGGVSIADLDLLPAGWSSPAVTGLREWVKQPEAQPGSWWRLNSRGSAALAWTALALGRERLARGEPAKAEAVWNAGLELAGFSDAVHSDLRTELALLYFRQPELDPHGNKFRSMENQLFNAKITALARHDLPSTQRLHTALGLIYAERGTWESAIRPRGALFQLESALSVAAARDQAFGTFQPLPWLRERLADGYRSLGRKKKAATAYLEAGRAYLDMDDLGKTAKMLEAGRAVAEPTWEATAEAKRLSMILDTRRRLTEAAERPAGEKPVLSRRALENLAGSAWLDPSWSHPDEDFGDRQRFKALADLAAVEDRSAAPELALRHGSQALEMALEEEDQVYLTGAGDLLRLQRLQALSARALGMTVPIPQVVAEREVLDTLPLALPSGGSSARVRVSPEGALANRIVLALGADAVLASHPELRIEDGKVLLIDVQPGTDVEELMGRMRKASGVERVVLTPRRSTAKKDA